MSEQASTSAHLFGLLVVQLCVQRVRLRDSKASWVGRLSVAAAEVLLEKARAIGMDPAAIWAEFEEERKAVTDGLDSGAV